MGTVPPLTSQSHSKGQAYAVRTNSIVKLTENVIESEIEDNLRQVDETLDSIKHLAVDLNVQLSIQEPKLDRIHELVENSDSAMGGANAKVKKLLSE
ncbi:unnamed protein product [Cylicocyclus nassatus]|uniref:t-SNARE coiled-coil homology domain-containing protein n=1 Tax=Cylicocyclus nassatus TaxID=53992 RepID=A0AA36HDK8_CYLNA|nr:unnamed protein product [Cylicocyclus nassatus]